MYAMWLTLAVYLGTELSLRVRTPRDVRRSARDRAVAGSFLVASQTDAGAGGREHRAALRCARIAHVDTAYAMNYVCLFLALRAMPAPEARCPWLVCRCSALLAWALYQVVFGLDTVRVAWCVADAPALRIPQHVERQDAGRDTSGRWAAAVALSVLALTALPEAVKGSYRGDGGALRVRADRPPHSRHSIGAPSPRWRPAGHRLCDARDSHNSYMNILMQLGWVGFLLALIAIARSVLMTWRMGFSGSCSSASGARRCCFRHSSRVQNTPGQANFIPLLVWYALSRCALCRPPEQETATGGRTLLKLVAAVVFVTTVFEGVDTGPGIYAHYLWRAFRDDPEVEFHVVAPEFAERHPRLHAAGTGTGSLDLYRRVQDKAMEVAAAEARRTILHGNSTHGMGRWSDTAAR